MTIQEFSDEFDVLYNNITSNQAPGLDEYEKSVFLTKAQDEIVKSYFDPRSNKVQEGFDGSERRQIDFSMIMRVVEYESLKLIIDTTDTNIPADTPDRIFSMGVLKKYIKGTIIPAYIKLRMVDTSLPTTIDTSVEGSMAIIVLPFTNGVFDLRNNTLSVAIEPDILTLVNEYIQVVRNRASRRLTVLPINYSEYDRLMNKPYKRPLKNQAWRLIDNSGSYNRAELIVGPSDTIEKYVIRYVKRPQAIIVGELDGVTLDGKSHPQGCELDPILHHEILQRAVELAKAAYIGDLQSQISLGQLSQTSIGVVPQSK